jgi:hypothetical protein
VVKRERRGWWRAGAWRIRSPWRFHGFGLEPDSVLLDYVGWTDEDIELVGVEVA